MPTVAPCEPLGEFGVFDSVNFAVVTWATSASSVDGGGASASAVAANSNGKSLRMMGPPPGILFDPALVAITAALPGAGLYAPAAGGAQFVDRAGDFDSERPLERDAPLLPPPQLHVPLAVPVQHRQPAQQRRVPGQRGPRRDLDVVDVLLGPVLVDIAAAGAAGTAIERHADSFARPGWARRGMWTTSAGARSLTRIARAAPLTAASIARGQSRPSAAKIQNSGESPSANALATRTGRAPPRSRTRPHS